ncbi:MAG TPA: lipopolysaccharide transport periplasmic protein LptA [Limnobacter sp.]|uniref:lipopolysaccharide transport periplasmic protein LptA n=1 Tax=Limnobacter sp. TaxID=2003368 RepID=UPI002ED96F80
MNHPPIPMAWALVSLFLYSATAWSLESDKKQPTTIDANQMNYNEKASVNVFTGNVLLTRGSLVVRGDKLTLRETKDGTQHATIEGSPARFKQQRDSTKPSEVLLINGTANLIELDGASSVVTLTGQANLQKSSNGQLTESITGNKIVYQQNSETLNVVGDGNGPGKSRVQAVIKPRDKAE